MNEQIKKHTYLGIAFAVIGFALVGGALILIPKLVDEKAATIASKTASNPQSAQTTGKGTTSGAVNTADNNATARDSNAEDGTGAAGSTSDKNNGNATASANTNAPIASDGPWELTLTDKFEPDATAQRQLKAIIAFLAKKQSAQIQVVGMNNIKKSSKLALKGANRIANTIAKESDIKPERMEVITEQQPDMESIVVKVIVQGGAQ